MNWAKVADTVVGNVGTAVICRKYNEPEAKIRVICTLFITENWM